MTNKPLLPTCTFVGFNAGKCDFKLIIEDTDFIKKCINEKRAIASDKIFVEVLSDSMYVYILEGFDFLQREDVYLPSCFLPSTELLSKRVYIPVDVVKILPPSIGKICTKVYFLFKTVNEAAKFKLMQ